MIEVLASGRGGSLVITGPAGIGKSTLVGAVTRYAHETIAPNSGAVASVTAVGSESEWPYSGLHLVLSGVLGRLTEASRDEFDENVDAFLSGLDDDAGTYDVAMRLQALMNLATCPVLVFVDDAHHLDIRSQEVLGFVARRLRSLPIGLVLAADSAQHSAVLLDGLSTLWLAELGPEEAIDLLLSTRGDMVESVAATLYERAGGNPRVLRDVADRMPTEQRQGLVALDRYLPDSPVLKDLILPDLDDLSRERRFALLVAAVSADLRIGPVLAALEGHDDVAEWLVREHLSVSEGSFQLRARAVASVIWRHAGLAERAYAHQLLADIYQRQDPQQAMLHRALVLVDYDDELATALQQVSGELVARGEFERSVAFAQESVRLTSNPDERVGRLLMSGGLASLAGRFDEAIQVSRARVRYEMSPAQKAELALLEVRARVASDSAVPTELIVSYAEQLAHTDPDLATQFWLVGAVGFADRIELTEATGYLACAEQHLADATESTWGTYRRTAAWLASLSGDFERARELIEADSKASDVIADAEHCVRHAMVLARLERFDEARRLLQVVTDHRRFGDSPAVLGHGYAVLTALETRAGRLLAAYDAARAWHRIIGGRHGPGGNVPLYMMRVNALMGDTESAERAHVEAQARARRSGHSWTTAMFQAAAGTMYLLFNRLDEAMSSLERARDHALAHDDPSLTAAEPDFIEVCVRRGELQLARSAFDMFAARVARVPTAWGRHVLARCHALVTEDEESLRLFAAAIRAHTHHVSPVELARTQLCYGERLRRLGRRAEAVEWLHRAVVVANECGAAGLAARAGEELGAGSRASVNAPPVRTGELSSLTEAERRVATLAAAGRRNREIAAVLYVSVRTVETHLGRIFRKLGVRSRAELTGMVVAADADPAGPSEYGRFGVESVTG